MARKRRNTKQETILELTNALVLNGQAVREGPKQKHWSRHNLKVVKPLTPMQEEMYHDFMQGKNIVAHGTAGTGKSYIALFLAMNELLHHTSTYERVIIVRSAVPTRDLGFMPGTLEEKVALYESPYIDMLHDLFGKFSTYEDMKDVGLIHFTTTSFIRGLTWDDCIVIVDECQNMTFHEINSVMTRLGNNSRIIWTGDSVQTDLNKKNEKSGIEQLIKIAEKMSEFSVVKFSKHDIVRGNLVKSWIEALEEIAP